MMNDYFIWNGVNCTEYGIHVLTQPDILIPQERVSTKTVYGRSGTLTKLEGDEVYSEFVLTAECIVEDMSNLFDISAWLRGGGTVTFANRPDGYYEARVCNQILFEKIVRGRAPRVFAVNFRCQPYFYHAQDEDIAVTQQLTVITNPGNAKAEPTITVTGTGDIILMFVHAARGTQTVSLSDVASGVTLDGAHMEAYHDGVSLNGHMDGEFPLLYPGDTTVSWTGDVTSVQITPHWRDL